MKEKDIVNFDNMDENLQMCQINTWCGSDVEHAICNWLYDKGYKK